MDPKEQLIGFDVREMWLDVDMQWQTSKKDIYLLRHDVEKPLSVDGSVWYSVFSEWYSITTDKTLPRRWQGIPRKPEYTRGKWLNVFSLDRILPVPNWPRQSACSSNLEELETYINKYWGSIWKPCWIIAITEILEENEEPEPRYLPLVPPDVDETWTFLGYDVADADLYTGLSDGILDSDQSNQLRSVWQIHLNQYHLFEELSRATEYVEIANQRVPSHAPFYVYGLYLVRSTVEP